MAIFDPAFKKTLVLEGGYSDNVYDTGGRTMYGVTEATARAWGYQGEMRDLPLTLAKTIYKAGYWNPNKLSQFTSQLLAENLFDAGVNCGPTTAATFLQKALNLLNKRATLWADLTVDGQIGPGTLASIKKALATPGGEEGLIKLFNIIRGAYYIQIAEKRAENEEFVLGWVLHRVWLENRK